MFFYNQFSNYYKSISGGREEVMCPGPLDSYLGKSYYGNNSVLSQ